MCGIAGIFSYRPDAPPADTDELMRIRERMRARGPDGAGLWCAEDGRVALAHRRLAIIDLSEAGAQPMADPETGNQIVFNGEIYNYAALRGELVRDGVAMRSHSDTEVLLKLYAREGAAMMRRLRGMYAFAIWDASRRELFLARDPFGVKPLYLADDGRTLRFASQVKALLEGQVDTRPDPAGHAGFLLWGSVPSPFTLYRGIRSLEAGHWILVREGRPRPPVCFASPLHTLRQTGSADLLEPEAALQAVAGAVRDSVAAHMVADVPVGVFLSAGLDSTMLAASAAPLGRLRTLTLGFREYDGSDHDEAALAAGVAHSLGADHFERRFGAEDFAADRERLLDAMDQPSIDGINTWFVSRVAAEHGLKVALSGIGGDELFGSYPSFRQVPSLRRAVAGLGPLGQMGRPLRRLLTPFGARLPSAKFAGLLEYGGTLEGAYLLRRAMFMPWEIGSLIGEREAAEGLEALDTMARLRAAIDGLDSERQAVSALEMQWYMRHQLLRDADWAGMAHSIEIRVPFVDLPLVASSRVLRALPPSDEKRMVARAVAPDLPPAVLARPKTGFAVPIHQWLNPGAGFTVGNLRQWGLQVHRRFAGDAFGGPPRHAAGIPLRQAA